MLFYVQFVTLIVISFVNSYFISIFGDGGMIVKFSLFLFLFLQFVLSGILALDKKDNKIKPSKFVLFSIVALSVSFFTYLSLENTLQKIIMY